MSPQLLALATAALLVAVAAAAALAVHRRTHTPPRTTITRDDTITADPVTIALANLTNAATGAPTTALAAHPQTGHTHHRDTRTGERNKADTSPVPRDTTAPVDPLTEPINTDTPIDVEPLATITVADTSQPVNHKAWKHAYKHRRVDILTAAADTYDPAIAAAAYTLAAAAARNSHHPDAEDLSIISASVVELVTDNPHLQPYRKTLRHTLTLPGNHIVTVTGADAVVLCAAAQTLTATAPDEAVTLLTTHPRTHPVLHVQLAVAQIGAGAPVTVTEHDVPDGPLRQAIRHLHDEADTPQ